MKTIATGCLLALLLVANAAHLQAADFQARVPSGQTLYFNLQGDAVIVVFPGNASIPANGWAGYQMPIGDLAIPDSIERDGTRYAVKAISNHAFYNCASLTSVSIAEGIRSVGASAFAGCSSMARVVIAASVDTIGTLAFTRCTSISEVVARRAAPPYSTSTIFSGCNLAAATLKVPCEQASAYAEITPWSTFGTIDDEDCQVTITALPNYAERGYTTGSGTYSLGDEVTLRAIASEGHFFACWSDGDTLNPRPIEARETATYTAFFFGFRHDTLYVATPIEPELASLTVGTTTPLLGIGAGSATLPIGAEVEIAALPMQGNTFLTWTDGHAENPRRIQLTADTTFNAVFAAAASIGSIATQSASIEVANRNITVSCPQGSRIDLYDIRGVRLYSHVSESYPIVIEAPSKGLFFVQIDGHETHQINILQ